MRVYTTFDQALNEIKRDIAELGMRVHPQTMQDKNVEGDPEYETMEYLNQIYTVTHPNLDDLRPFVKTWAWCESEFHERIAGITVSELELEDFSPAWKKRPEVWAEYQGHFGYTYGERYRGISPHPAYTGESYTDNLSSIVCELKHHPDTRQAFLPVFDDRDPSRFGKVRVPCSLGYWFALRQNRLHITYLQRSGDYFTHLANDLWLTHRLQLWVAQHLDVKPGQFTHWIGSLHVYQKDVADVF